MGKFYSLKEELTQENMYQMIFNAETHGFRVSIHTDMEKLTISDTDEDTLETYQELDRILFEGSVYEKIGFLYMENIKIEKVEVWKNKLSMTMYPSSIYSSADFEWIKNTLAHCRFNPNWWIVGEIKQNGDIVPVSEGV